MPQPILAIVHVYYADLWNELRDALSNITVPYDLYVTAIDGSLKDQVLSFKPDAHFITVENRGYDVGPFVFVLNQVNLDDYSYVIKLHTKRDLSYGSKLNGYNMSFDRWRGYALSFLKKENFEKCLTAFETNPKLGMVSDYHLIFDKEPEDKKAADGACRLLDKIGLPMKQVKFVAGTIFMCRAELLKVVQKLQLKFSDFEVPDRKRKTSLAHIMERFFGCAVIAQGSTLEDVVSDPTQQKKDKKLTWLRHLWCFIYYAKVNKRGILRVRICKIFIPVPWFIQKSDFLVKRTMKKELV